MTRTGPRGNILYIAIQLVWRLSKFGFYYETINERVRQVAGEAFRSRRQERLQRSPFGAIMTFA